MKKNAVGRVLMHKESAGKRIGSLHLLARFVCLLLALVIWLSVVNLNKLSEGHDRSLEEQSTQETEI